MKKKFNYSNWLKNLGWMAMGALLMFLYVKEGIERIFSCLLLALLLSAIYESVRFIVVYCMMPLAKRAYNSWKGIETWE